MRWIVIVLVMAGTAMAGPYRDGVIYPATPEARITALTAFYADWKATYLRECCGEGRALVDVGADGKWVGGGTADNTLTVSEAHGYGMLVLVLMADHDPDARRLFDAMLTYRDDHPAASNKGLMAWNQLNTCENAGADVGGEHSATDGDLDIAFALLLAAKRWPDGGYKTRAIEVLDGTLARVKAPGADFLTIGDWAQTDATYAATTRSSDFMPSHFRAFAAASGDPVWTAILDQTYAAFDAAGSDLGLVPDFITGMPHTPKPAEPMFLEGDGDGALSWNAVRVPWRLALDDLLFSDPRAHQRLLAFNAFIRAATKGDPAAIRDGYFLNGQPVHPDWAGGMAFTSMFAVAAMSDPDGQVWLDALWSHMLATPLREDDYYGNTLKLLALITLTGLWDQP
jgi:endoglucanase